MQREFSAVIYRLGILYCVDVPRSLSEALGGENYIPVAGTVGGVRMRGLLVPAGGGGHRLFLDGKVRKAARVGQEDAVTLVLGPDLESREVAIPTDVRQAFDDEPGALQKFRSLTQAQRREILLWILKARHEETRATRIARLVHKMAKRPRRGGG